MIRCFWRRFLSDSPGPLHAAVAAGARRRRPEARICRRSAVLAPAPRAWQPTSRRRSSTFSRSSLITRCRSTLSRTTSLSCGSIRGPCGPEDTPATARQHRRRVRRMASGQRRRGPKPPRPGWRLRRSGRARARPSRRQPWFAPCADRLDSHLHLTFAQVRVAELIRPFAGVRPSQLAGLGKEAARSALENQAVRIARPRAPSVGQEVA